MKTVMIVDDDKSAQDKLHDMLASYSDIKVILVAGTIEEAKHILSSESPDILFLDLELPDGNGMDLLDFVHEYHPGMYVIVFTAFYEGVNGEAYKRGENDYLLKPIIPNELDKVIRRYQALDGNTDTQTPDLRKGKLYDTIAMLTMKNELRPTKCSEIGFFRYNSERKLWTAILEDSTALTLRKGTTARDIMQLNPLFQQCHQSFIVNLSHVRLIGNTQVRLRKPFHLYSIPMGRTFFKPMLNRFKLV